MKNKVKFLVIILIFFSFNSFSQGKIEFQDSSHDFGNVSEGTLATYDFTFTNIGNDPLVITNVKASCGCTTPYWTKEPVMPGKQGKITASYDSKNRPGAFNKSISVTSNAQQPNSVLFIKGVVVSKENVEKVFSDKDISESPKVNLQKTSYQAGKIEKGQSIPLAIEVANLGKRDLIITQVKSACNCFRLDPNAKKAIKPGAKEDISIIFTPASLGKKNESVSIYSNDITQPETQFVVEAEVVENLSNKSIIKEKTSTITF